jgi:hypothetical protein
VGATCACCVFGCCHAQICRLNPQLTRRVSLGRRLPDHPTGAPPKRQAVHTPLARAPWQRPVTVAVAAVAWVAGCLVLMRRSSLNVPWWYLLNHTGSVVKTVAT